MRVGDKYEPLIAIAVGVVLAFLALSLFVLFAGCAHAPLPCVCEVPVPTPLVIRVQVPEGAKVHADEKPCLDSVVPKPGVRYPGFVIMCGDEPCQAAIDEAVEETDKQLGLPGGAGEEIKE